MQYNLGQLYLKVETRAFPPTHLHKNLIILGSLLGFLCMGCFLLILMLTAEDIKTPNIMHKNRKG